MSPGQRASSQRPRRSTRGRHHPACPLGGARGRGPGGPAHPDLARRPIQKRKGLRAARAVQRTLAVRQGIKQRALAGCPCHLVLPTSKSPPPAASNWLPSTDHPFGAKSQCRPTVTSIHHPELYEGRPATIEPLPVPLQHAAVPVPRAHAQHGQAAIVSPWLLAQCYGHAVDAVCRRHDELRRAVADDPHEQGREHLHQLPVQSRSPQQ